MPATFTRTPAEIDRKDTGIGGKPPVDRRPTGGGGGDDNWDNHPQGRRGPRELLTRYRLGLFFALAGDLMFFIALVSAFFVRQNAGHFDPRDNYVSDWHPLAIPPILWINTAILLLSSLSIEIARQHLFHEVDVMEEWLGLGRPAVRRASPWLVGNGRSGIHVSGGTVDRLATACIAGLVLCDEPEQPLLLPDYGDAWNPSCARHSCAGYGALRAVSAAACGDAADRR